MDAQLTIFDALDAIAAEHQEAELGMRRIGDGPELGRLLLMPLVARGWRLRRVRAFGGSPHRTLFIFANGVFEVKAEGAQLAEVALELFEQASKLCGAAA